ncbi:MAG: hypothetical protein M3439_07185 [Chloroflexota bacterium]|nr:hypothetical protein [Chloroflexota bacterium]
MSASPDPVDSTIRNITGEGVALGPLRCDLVALYKRWLNDFSHARNFDDTPEPWTTARTVALFEARATASNEIIKDCLSVEVTGFRYQGNEATTPDT